MIIPLLNRMKILSAACMLSLSVIARADETHPPWQVLGGEVVGDGKSIPLTQAKAKEFYDTLVTDKESYKAEYRNNRVGNICVDPSPDGTVIIHLRKNGRDLSASFDFDASKTFWCLAFHWNKECSQKALEVLKKPE